MPSITFLGAARTVTGSKYLLDHVPVRADADSLRLAIEQRHRWPCTVAEHLQAVQL